MSWGRRAAAATTVALLVAGCGTAASHHRTSASSSTTSTAPGPAPAYPPAAQVEASLAAVVPNGHWVQNVDKGPGEAGHMYLSYQSDGLAITDASSGVPTTGPPQLRLDYFRSPSVAAQQAIAGVVGDQQLWYVGPYVLEVPSSLSSSQVAATDALATGLGMTEAPPPSGVSLPATPRH